MSTSVDYIEFVMDSIGEIPRMEFRYKKMFGEYCVYANEKPILLVCNNLVYAKMLPCLESLMSGVETQAPYSGAKEHYLLDIENEGLVRKVIPLLEQHALLPKPRKTKWKKSQ